METLEGVVGRVRKLSGFARRSLRRYEYECGLDSC